MAEKFAEIKYLPQFGAECFVFGDIPVCRVSSAVADKILAAVNSAHEAAVEKAVKEAVEKERERCAKIIESMLWGQGAKDIVAAIREKIEGDK